MTYSGEGSRVYSARARFIAESNGGKECHTHALVEWPKSTRERYIRVAAIVIVISDGIKNICVGGTHKEPVSSIIYTRHNKQIRTISNASGFGRRINILRRRLGVKDSTVQIQIHDHLWCKGVMGDEVYREIFWTYNWWNPGNG